MFNGRYMHQSADWRIDLRVETGLPNPQLNDISGDIFQRLPTGEERYFSSFSIGKRYLVQTEVLGIQHHFGNRVFRTQGTSNPGTPENVEVLLQLIENKPVARVNFQFKQPQEHIALYNPFLCEKISGFFRHVELHLYHDKLNVPIPFPIPAMAPAIIAQPHTQPADALIEIFQREGILVEYANGDPVLLDRQSATGSGWRRRELHDLMTGIGFDPAPTDPVWKVWSFITDQFDLSDGAFLSLAGYSFDNIGERRRQGIAVFLNDKRFEGLEDPKHSHRHAQANNAYLFTLAHELAHGLGLTHTNDYINPNGAPHEPPDLMNEDFSLARGDNGDWAQFHWGFIPEESRLLRHATWRDAAPGSFGAAFGSGKQQAKPTTPGLELRIRSQGTFLCTEPLEIEVRLRCQEGYDDLTVYPAFSPEAGLVCYQIRPEGVRKWQTIIPLVQLHGQPRPHLLQRPELTDKEGLDRISGLVPLFNGANSISPFKAGVYKVRAEYRDASGQRAVSNVHTIRISGEQYNWVQEINASSPSFRSAFLEFCYLHGSADERFANVQSFLTQMLRQLEAAISTTQNATERNHLERLRAKTQRLVGLSIGADHWTVASTGTETGAATVLKQSTPGSKRCEQAAAHLDKCVRFFRQRTNSKRQNFAYRRATEEQINLLKKAQQTDQIAGIAGRLEKDLKNRGVSGIVTKQLNTSDNCLATV